MTIERCRVFVVQYLFEMGEDVRGQDGLVTFQDGLLVSV